MKIAKSYMTRTSIGLLATTLLVLVCGTTVATAQSVTIALSIKNHRFQPAEINAPANKPITLRIKNLDATPMEFESISLRVEKVIGGNSEGTINLRALQPGRYKFFDDFHQDTGQGVLVVN